MHPSARPQWRPAWWVLLLGLTAIVLFRAALVVRVHCGTGHCAGSAAGRLLDLDAVGGLPRLFTTGVFVAVVVLAGRACRPATGRARLWWAAVAAAALALAVLKLASAHSLAKTETSPLTTLLLGLAVAVPSLGLLAVAGRAWGVAATARVVAALAGYALAALGLDVLTSRAGVLAGGLAAAPAMFVEELGEALAAVAVMAVVRSGTAVARPRR
ncbi:hypothetical protein ACI8AA_15060 [Geodermatophilus sp. SYSU D01180]